ncbi:hypothetical protein DUI87_31122 [Hirundo rustica rustica]|uniref:Uncharacterized protein n=1 Tax=Hirundo rustica rustica TaxID=333673 RepID=A0A3M0IX24_HIRRU|nr:hypothetical protein DUI87_31122 [Hirundo rustica rustica]
MVKTMVREEVPLQPMEINRIAEIHPLPMEETHIRAVVHAVFGTGPPVHSAEERCLTRIGVDSISQQVAKATEGEGGSSQLAELKAVQLALDIAEREKWPKLCLYTDS